ncbi:hypothetical protein BDN67DRAFT_415034 [Paxillus ammoniavirescens]|nr:hypothetical protein BDN67DRAFT_415034 [Paxillus ammoniavirescens]
MITSVLAVSVLQENQPRCTEPKRISGVTRYADEVLTELVIVALPIPVQSSPPLIPCHIDYQVPGAGLRVLVWQVFDNVILDIYTLNFAPQLCNPSLAYLISHPHSPVFIRVDVAVKFYDAARNDDTRVADDKWQRKTPKSVSHHVTPCQ